MTASRSSKRLVAIAHVLGWLSLGIWMFFIYLILQYDATRPTVPVPSEGRIYASDTHGHVVYLTATEVSNLHHLAVGAFLLFGIAFLLGYQSAHPKVLGEIRNNLWMFFCSLFTAAGWSALGRSILREGRSIAESTRSMLSGSERVWLRSELPLADASAKLQKWVYLNAMEICGDAHGNKVHLFVARKDLRNSFSPHFYGTLRARAFGTAVRGRFTLSRFAMVFGAFWFGVVGAVAFIVSPPAIEALITGRPLVSNPVLAAFFPPLLFAGGLLIFHWGYRLGRGDKAEIVKFLQQSIGARQESYL